MATDPVCGKEVSERNWLASGSFRRFMGERPYFFCSLDCRRQFSASPAEFLIRRSGGTVTTPFTLPNFDDTTTSPAKLSLAKTVDTEPYSPESALDAASDDAVSESTGDAVAPDSDNDDAVDGETGADDGGEETEAPIDDYFLEVLEEIEAEKAEVEGELEKADEDEGKRK